VIGLIGGVVDSSENVFTFQERVITQDFLKGGSCSKQFKNISYADALAANTGTPSTFAFFDSDSTKTLQIHVTRSSFKIRCLPLNDKRRAWNAHGETNAKTLMTVFFGAPDRKQEIKDQIRKLQKGLERQAKAVHRGGRRGTSKPYR
jgi:hypothetical protein